MNPNRSNRHQHHATFSVLRVIESTVFLVDGDNGPTITNDAENVVGRVLSNYPAHRIIYKDTDGCWSELRHDGHRFTVFASLSKEDHTRYSTVFQPATC